MSDFKEQFYKPFEDIRQRKGRGGTYDYITWKDVADRMNEIFGMNWSSSSESQELIGNNIVIRVKVCARHPETGEHFCQEGYGGAVNRDSDEPGTAHKSAYSKALKDACKKWGIALHIEDTDELPASKTNIPDGFTGYTTGVPIPPTQTSSPVPPVSFTPPTPPTFTQPVVAPPVVETPKQENLWPPAQPTPPIVEQIFTPPAPIQSVSPVVNTSNQNLPPIPAPLGINKNAGYAPPVMPSIPSIDTSAAEMTPDTPSSITNVQEMAIKNLAKLKGYTDETIEVFLTDLVNNPVCGLDRKCAVKDLSYNEAVCVIKTTKNLQ